MTTYRRNDTRRRDIHRSPDMTADDFRQLWSLNQEPTPSERVGIAASIIVLVLAFVMLVMWAESRSSFERCSAISNIDARAVCYEELRQQEMRPPAKGASAPAGLSGSQN